MQVLTDLCYLLEDEVGQVVRKGELSPTELDNIYKAMKTMYYTKSIEAMDGYSEGYAEGYARGNSNNYAGGNSNNYARGNSSYGGSYGNSNGNSYGNSRRYSRHSKEEMLEELDQMLAKTSSEAERRTIMECIRKIEN